MPPIKQNNRESSGDLGFTLIELMISMTIVSIISIAVLTLMAAFYADGQETSDLSRRIANAASMESIGDHFLARSDYNAQPVSATLSVPAIQGKNTGITIQWMPYVPTATTVSSPVICTGTLTDKTVSPAPSQGATPGVQTNGVEWSAQTAYGTSGYCGGGTAFFPANNQWGFTLVQRQGCPNPTHDQNAVVITSNYAYGTTKLQGISGTPNTQVVTVCLPNS